jgi:PAS domain S-box-containing protein
MSSHAIQPNSHVDLRMRALSRLNGHSAPVGARASASAALGVLHELASSPSTAAKALALLHELQVLQVELDLQAEELRISRAELEADLVRQTQLYDFAPVACFTVDRDTTLCELNLAGAQLLGFERDALLGRALDSFLAPHSGRALRAMLTRVGEGRRGEVCALQFTAPDGTPHVLNARANADPAGRRFLVALSEVASTAPPGPEAAGRTLS